MRAKWLIILTASAAASQAHAEGSMVILGTTAFAACAAGAVDARLTAIGTRAELDACDRAVQTWPAVPADVAVAFVNRSVIDLARGDTRAAMTDTGAAIRRDPSLAEAYLNRGIALSGEGHRAEAIRDFSEAISRNLRNPELAYFDRAMAREDSGDVSGAYFDYRQAAALNPAWDKPRGELPRFTVVRGPTS